MPATTAPQGTPRINGARVVQLRLARGLQQKELAERVGISKSFMNDIERGRRSGSPAVRLQLAQALEVDSTELYAEADA